MKHIHIFSGKNLDWINVTDSGKAQMRHLAKQFGFEQEDVLDVLPPIQRTKTVLRKGYLFLILLFPVYNRETRDIFIEEVDFFLMKNTLITIHQNNIPELRHLFEEFKKNPRSAPKSASALLFHLLDMLYTRCFPMLRHINEDIENIEKGIFQKFEQKQNIESILLVKTNIFDFQRALQSHAHVLRQLANKLVVNEERGANNKEISELLDYISDISLSLEGYKNAINALHETNSTLVEYRVNEIMKMLTIFAVIVFPLTLLSSMFGMNTQDTPIIGQFNDFWKITGIMFSGAIIMLSFFKWKKWL